MRVPEKEERSWNAIFCGPRSSSEYEYEYDDEAAAAGADLAAGAGFERGGGPESE